MAKTIQQQLQDVIDHISFCNHAATPFDADELINSLQKIAKHSEDYRIALENLTPGGSEFYNDKDYCVQWIQKRITERHEVLKENAKLRKELRKLQGN